jgi:hypothetical protein
MWLFFLKTRVADRPGSVCVKVCQFRVNLTRGGASSIASGKPLFCLAHQKIVHVVLRRHRIYSIRTARSFLYSCHAPNTTKNSYHIWKRFAKIPGKRIFFSIPHF